MSDPTELHTLEAAYHPAKKLSFLLDWLVTLKCNFDCDYCAIGPDGHDNSKAHPPKHLCLKMLKHSYEYVDCYMEQKSNRFRDVHLNIYGGESLYHPDIEELMEESSRLFEPYKNRWNINRRMTTNASATLKKWKNVVEHLEGVTFSYHPQGSEKMKNNFINNVEYFVTTKKDYDIVILMYPKEPFFTDSLNFLKNCIKNNLNARPRLLDGFLGIYSDEQLAMLRSFYVNKNTTVSSIDSISNNNSIVSQGRACCGGRQMCVNRDLKNPVKFIQRQNGFEGWHCSANHWFLMMNSVTKEFYTNKDCRVRSDGSVGALATVDTIEEYIKSLKIQLQQNKNFFLKCAQKTCRCGTCAPKSMHKENLTDIMKIYNVDSSKLTAKL
jgi:hypothetical protein